MHTHKTADPGTGEQFLRQTKRIINPDGTFNVKRVNSNFSFSDLFQYFLALTWRQFGLILALVYLAINFLFASIYYFIGIEYLPGAYQSKGATAFMDAFFFSVQTFTTVGYGTISPAGFWTNAVASIEAFSGWIMFSLSTGLIYGRFSRPNSRFCFSRHAIITPHNGKPSLQFRVANKRSNTMIEMETRLMLVVADENVHFRRQYYDLRVERQSIYFFALNWTIVHPIDQDSPLFGKSADELRALNAELLVLLRGFDDSFNQTVHARYSYRYDDLLWNVRFTRAYYPDEEGNVILDIKLMDAVEPIENDKPGIGRNN